MVNSISRHYENYPTIPTQHREGIMSDSNGHDCWDNAVMYEEFDEEGNFFHGHECGVCQEFLCAS